MNLVTLIEAASFIPESLSAPNAWVGHLPFASWAISEIKPKVYVELGTHTGNSYFSICQTIKYTRVNSKCFAIDTWAGDDHAGKYGEEIFTKVDSHNKKNYADFSTLLRMTFDQALDSFEDGSVDFLHIDGLHTYEAVRHDFETWLPKLAPGAIVLFHDTNVFDRDFGVWQLWQELQKIYPNNIEFLHSHGLGVLQLNNSSNDQLVGWLAPGSHDKPMLKKYFESLGDLQINRFKAYELQEALHIRDQRIAELVGDVVTANQEIQRRGQQINECNQEMKRLLASLSWRLTRPLRSCRALFRKID